MKPLAALKAETKLSAGEQRVLADARAGKRTHEMSGWTFRIGRHGLQGRKAVQVRPWGHDAWLFVQWCNSAGPAQTLGPA